MSNLDEISAFIRENPFCSSAERFQIIIGLMTEIRAETGSFDAINRQLLCDLFSDVVAGRVSAQQLRAVAQYEPG